MARDPYRRQIRRARRAMRRRGSNDPFQLVILGPDEPLGLIAFAAAGRWAYRHRAAFVPFGIALTAFALAAYVHPYHARYWLPVFGVTVTVTVVMGIPHGFVWSIPAGKVPAGVRSRLPSRLRLASKHLRGPSLVSILALCLAAILETELVSGCGLDDDLGDRRNCGVAVMPSDRSAKLL